MTSFRFASFPSPLRNHADANLLEKVYTLTALRDLLLWLNDWPGGVKLNFELATIFCDAFLWGTGLWEERAFPPPSNSLSH